MSPSRIALVTGAANGIGMALSRALLDLNGGVYMT
jgi:NAD(P)-dependent dehydrogenase (short-subunit alcohol dehydrogenase family)